MKPNIPESNPSRRWPSRLATKTAACFAALCFAAGLGRASAIDFILNGDFEGTGGTPNPAYVTGFAQYHPATLYWPWSAFGNSTTGGGFEQPNGVGRYPNPSVDANNPSPTVWEDFGNPTYVNSASQNYMTDVWLLPGATYHMHAQYYVPSSEVGSGITPRAGYRLTMMSTPNMWVLDPNTTAGSITTLDGWVTFDFDWVCPGTLGGAPLQINYSAWRLYSWNGTALGTANPGGYFDNLSFSSDAYTGTLSGLVKNSSGPLEGVTIMVNYNGNPFRTSPREVATPSDGTYNLAGLIDGQTFSITASKTGYISQTVTATASAVVPDITLVPAPTYTRYECENFIAAPSVNMISVADGNASNGHRAAKNSQGGTGTLIIPVTVATTGVYDMQMVTYFNGRQTFISVNGTDVASSPVTSSNPDAYGYCHNSVPVILKAGANTIVLYNNIDWGPHWDYIDVADSSSGPAIKITSSVDGTGTGTGTILPLGDIYVGAGSSMTFTVTPALASAIDTVLVNGSPSSAPYTVTPLADSTIVAKFVALSTHTIMATAGTGGSISPSGSVVVVDGTDQTFTIATAFGYSLADVVVDGFSIGPVTSHTFSNNTANHTIAASFTDLGGAKLPIGTVAYWPFDNALTDPIGGNNLKGTAGTVAYGPAKFGAASLYLDGTTTLGTLSGLFPTGVPTGNNAYSVACFVKADPTSQGNGGWLGYGSPGYTNGTLSMNFRMSGYTSANVYWWNNDQGGTIPNGGNFTTAWHSVVATYDGATRIMYIDGVNVAQGTPSAPANVSNSQFVVGKTLGDVNLKGWIDDLLILNRAMTAAEAQDYNTNGALLASGPSPIPYATWALTNAPGQTASEDYNNDGVQNGIAYFMGTGLDHATNPGLNASNNVTWPMSATFSGTYEVQTSSDLGTWTNVTPKPTASGGFLTYHLPTGQGKKFVRLLVIPN